MSNELGNILALSLPQVSYEHYPTGKLSLGKFLVPILRCH